MPPAARTKGPGSVPPRLASQLLPVRDQRTVRVVIEARREPAKLESADCA